MKSVLSGDVDFAKISIEIDALFTNWENPSLGELPSYVVKAGYLVRMKFD